MARNNAESNPGLDNPELAETKNWKDAIEKMDERKDASKKAGDEQRNHGSYLQTPERKK
ncbi:MAG TPA: hypothetical protein VLI92_02610 [Candidatus Saccharimonadales bacterium]|nr:hypothetical protein [Candidatus Saccharimonadales bacterium]